jgi:hypothetical protein
MRRRRAIQAVPLRWRAVRRAPGVNDASLREYQAKLTAPPPDRRAFPTYTVEHASRRAQAHATIEAALERVRPISSSDRQRIRGGEKEEALLTLAYSTRATTGGGESEKSINTTSSNARWTQPAVVRHDVSSYSRPRLRAGEQRARGRCGQSPQASYKPTWRSIRLWG